MPDLSANADYGAGTDVEYGVRINGHVEHPDGGYDLERYKRLAQRENGQVVFRFIGPWLDLPPNDGSVWGRATAPGPGEPGDASDAT